MRNRVLALLAVSILLCAPVLIAQAPSGTKAFDPKAVAQLQAWLQLASATSSNMAYQLSVQLAVMDLNVLTGYVQTTDLVYAGGLLPYATGYGLTGLTSGGFISIGGPPGTGAVIPGECCRP